MATKTKSKDAWRGEFVPRDDFKCACGCALQLTRGDLADAMRVALIVGQNPSPSFNVKRRTATTERAEKPEKPEASESRPCPKCRSAIVTIPTYAVEALTNRGANWPNCERCEP
jgi:hypothetical protein